MNRALFVGYGWAARTLWQPALSRAGFDVFGALDAYISRESAYACGATRIHRSIAEIETQMYDVAIVASPNRTHVDMAIRLLDRSIATVVEKPVCLSRADVGLLKEATHRGGAPLLRSRSSHYEPHIIAFAEQLRRTAENSSTSISASWIRGDGLPRSRWQTSVEHAMAGSSIDLGWHLLECLMDLTGPDDLTLEHAQFGTVESIGSVVSPGFAEWYGTQPPECDLPARINVDVAARLQFRQHDRAINLETAWVSTAPADAVMFEVGSTGRTLKLNTLLGVSPAAGTMPAIESRAGRRVGFRRLPPRVPGEAHRLMVDNFVNAGFDPEAVGQTWRQLEVLAGAAESIVSAHSQWQAAVTT